MSVKNAAPVRLGYCHSVDLSSNGRLMGPSREEAFYSFTAQWRGVPVVVEMTANRYRHDGGWSDWRIHSTSAVEGSLDADGRYVDGRGPSVTDTARQRLADACRPMVAEWLASEPAYVPSRAAAFGSALEREVRDLSSYSVDRVRRDLDHFAPELTERDRKRLSAAVDAYEVFAGILAGK